MDKTRSARVVLAVTLVGVLALGGCGRIQVSVEKPTPEQAQSTPTPVQPTLTQAPPTATSVLPMLTPTPIPPTDTPVPSTPTPVALQFKESAPECAGVTSAITVSTPIALEPDVPIWLPVANPAASELTHIDMVSPSAGWVVGKSGTILRLQDGIWVEEPSPTDEDLISIDTISEGEAYAVSKKGEVLAYDGSQWLLLNSTPLPTDKMEGAQFLSKTAGWASYVSNVGERIIAKFNGSSWETEFTSEDAPRLALPTARDFSMTSPQEGWAVGYGTTRNPILFHYQNGQWTYGGVDRVADVFAIDVNRNGVGWAVSDKAVMKLEAGVLRLVNNNKYWTLHDVLTFDGSSSFSGLSG